VLDDLHWADVATLELLGHAVQALARQPLLFAVSFRDRDVALDAAQLSAIRRLSRRAQRFSLRGLSLEEVASLAGALHGGAAPSELAAQVLFERTRGNPFFVRQLFELLAQRGVRPEPRELLALEPPPAVQEVIRQRIVGLPEETHRLLAVASVIGHEFAASLLSDLADQPLAQALDRLEPARRVGLLQRHRTIANRLAFEHALVREALYGELSLAAAGALHGKLVHMLEARGRGDSQELGELARHALAAVPFEPVSCLRQCRAAAAAARATSGFEAAAELLSRALEKLTSEGCDAQTRCELSLELGVDQYCAGEFDPAWRTLSAGALLAKQLDSPESAELLARSAFRLLDCAEAGSGNRGEVKALIELALLRVDQAQRALRAVLLAHRAELASDLPFEERLRMLAEADSLVAESDTPELSLEVANCRAGLRHPTELEHGRTAAARLRELTGKAPARLDGIRLRVQRFSAELSDYLCALVAGELDAADGFALRAHAFAAEARLVPVRLAAEFMSAGRALGDGALTQLEQHIAHIRAIAPEGSSGLGHGFLYYTLLLAEARDAWPSFAGFDLPTGSAQQSLYDSRARIVFAWFFAQTGRLERARGLLAEIPKSELSRMPVLHGDLGSLCQLAETVCSLRDLGRAAWLRRLLTPYAALNAVGPCLEYRGSVAHYVGLLASLLGERSEAAERFEQAQALNERLGMPLQLARTRHQRALLAT